MELKRWMIVEHILFKTCVILNIEHWIVFFTSTLRKGTVRMLNTLFSPYINPVLDNNGKIMYSKTVAL